MKKSILVLSMLIGISVLVFNSCSKSSDTTPAVTPSPVAGKWQRTNGSVLFNLTFNTDNTYSATASGQTLETGYYSTPDTSITFNSNGGTSGCIGKLGKYTYVISGSTITFKLFSDSCAVRIGTTVGSWNKIP